MDKEKHVSPSAVQPIAPSGEQEKKSSVPDKSEQRELLKKNVTEGQGQRHPDTPAGQHATGSFTGDGKS